MAVVGILIQCIMLQMAFAKYQSNEDLTQFLENELKGFGKSPSLACKSKSLSYLLSVHNNFGKARLPRYCTLQALLRVKKISDIERSKLWTFLGTLYKESGNQKKRTICQKEAVRLAGKLVMFQKWDFLGPFPIGKMEVDADPVAEFGVDKAIKLRWDKNFKMYSELVLGGEVKWTKVQSSKMNGIEILQIQPLVDWHDIVTCMQSTALTEWQGWLVAEIAVNEDREDYIVQCIGVNYFYIDDVILNGDVYGRGITWYPISLDYGVHTVRVYVRTKMNINIQFVLTHSSTNGLKIYSPSMVPDLIDTNWFSGFFAIPVTNQNTVLWLYMKDVFVAEHDLPYSKLHARLVNADRVAPGQTTHLSVKVSPEPSENGLHNQCDQESYSIKLSLIFQDDAVIKVDATVRCRGSRESFIFTFLDHDGSVQNAAAIRPFEMCALDACPVLVSHHGTGVTPSSQADSYKRWISDRFHFGIEKMWILAPRRHGAHNWEGPGEASSVRALKSLARLTQAADWLVQAADDRAVIFAGHSMGGHGAWQLATHHPDIAIAVVSIAGWLKKECYGEDNAFYRHAVSTSYVEPAIKAIQEACTAEHDVDKHAANLKGVPVLIRVGQEDKTVHPYYSRRMLRLLHQHGVNVTYKEVPLKAHWWWDTKKTNDGGVMNDPEMRGFVVSHIEDFENHMQSGYSFTGTEESFTGKSKYYNVEKGAQHLEVVVYNPASFEGAHGIRILQQKLPFRRSSVKLTVAKSSVSMVTTNVERLELYEPYIRSLEWKRRSLTIDQQDIVVTDLPVFYCLNHGWQLCEEQTASFESNTTRGPATFGPARRVIEKPFMIIVGTAYPVKQAPLLLRYAVYLANLFSVLSNGLTTVFHDVDVSEESVKDKNIILVGDRTFVPFLRAITQRSVIKFHKYTASIGNCSFKGSLLSAVYLAPHGNNNLALVIAGVTVNAVINGMHLAQPTIPPMARAPFTNMVPDFVLLSSSVRGQGAGGYLCSGFLDNHWKYRPELSSCVC